MIPFGGESVGVDVALVVEGVGVYDESLYDSIRRRGSIGSAPPERTLGADEWRAWVYPGSQTYLEEPGADVVASWVVEVASGSGTITASMGLDPMYGDPDAAHPTPLGSHTVTGPATLVLPTTLTAADVMTGGAAMMLVLTAAGSVQVQQIKLRVWPAAGVAGGWSDVKPSWSASPSPAQIVQASIEMTGAASSVDAAAAWDAAIDDFHGSVSVESATQARPFIAGTPVGAFADQTMIRAELGNYTAAHTLLSNLFMVTGQDWSTAYPIDGSALTEGVDWVRPPAEVADDVMTWAQQVGEGSTGFTNATATVTVGSLGDLVVPGAVTVHSASGAWADVDAGSGWTYIVPVVHAGTVIDTGATSTVPLDTGARQILVAISHTIAVHDADDYPGWVPGILAPIQRRESVSSLTFGDGQILSFAVLPPYRVWSPTAVASVVSVVRHGVRNDGLMSTAPRRWGQVSSFQSGRGGGYQ